MTGSTPRAPTSTALEAVTLTGASYQGMFDAIPADAGIKVALSGIQVPRMNARSLTWAEMEVMRRR